MRFYAIETDITKPGPGTYTYTKGWGVRAWGTQSRRPGDGASSSVLRASDTGYRTRTADAGGLVVFPVAVDYALAFERAVSVGPSESTVTVGAGQLSAANVNGRYDSLVAGWVTDGKAAKVYTGAKTYDTTRGYWVDPPRASLSQIFGGLALQWYTSDTALVLPVRDPSYWLESPYQANRYTGGGGYAGHSSIGNYPLPRTRGGTAGNPVRNVRPVLIDPTTHTYQYTDGPGTVVAVYEGANPVYTFQADTTNLFAGTTTTGQYRTDNSRGCFQITPAGAAPAGEITADVTGAFPTAGAVSALDSIARYMVAEDAAVPSANIDTASFTGASYTAGLYFHPDDKETTVQALDRLLSSVGARLVAKRDGRLAFMLLRDPVGVPVASFGPHNIMAVQIDQVDVPAYRITVAYKKNNTLQTTGVSAGATAAQRAFVAGPGERKTWVSTTVLAAYPKARDIGPIGGALMLAADAQTIADAMGALLGVRRRIAWVEVPAELGLAVDMGALVRVTWPADDLVAGRIGQVLGDRLRTQDGTIRLRVLL